MLIHSQLVNRKISETIFQRDVAQLLTAWVWPCREWMCVCEAMVVFGSFLSLSSLINSQCLDSVSVHFYQGRRVCINSFYYKKIEQEIGKKERKKNLIFQKEERGWVSTGANKWQILGQTDSIPEWKKRSDNDNQVSVPAGMRSTPSVPWEPIIGLLPLCGYRRERETSDFCLQQSVTFGG